MIENIFTLKEKAKTEYENDNTNKTMNVNLNNSLTTKKEINENNITSRIYKIDDPVQIQYNQISRNITTENNDLKKYTFINLKIKQLLKSK